MFSILSAALGIFAAAASPASPSHLLIKLCDGGEHYQFQTATCDIELSNSGDEPIRVFDARAVSRWDRIESGVTVPPKSTAYLKATIGMSDSVGFSHRWFRFSTSESGPPAQGRAVVQVFSASVLDQQEPKIDFEASRLDEPVVEKTISLSSRDVADFRIKSIVSKPDFVDATVDPGGKSIRASVRKDARWGQQSGRIVLKINGGPQIEAAVAVSADVQGDVVPDSAAIALGLMNTNRKNEFLMRLTSRSGKAFKVGKLDFEGIKGSASSGACASTAKGCQLITILIANDQAQGRIGGTLFVELPEFKQTLPIRLGAGILLDPSVKIHDLDEEQKKAAETASKSAAPALPATNAIDVKQAIQQTIARKDETPPAGKGPLLRWSVANQLLVYGYIIYRSESETGPFVRVNPQTIRKQNDADSQSGSYQWRDNTAVSGKTYWYSITTVNEDGKKVELSGPQKVVAK